jgi:DNA-binding transcriptional MerR regulator
MNSIPAWERKGTRSDETYLLIGEVSEATGLTQRTIRYYEELGLLPPPSRTQGDYRLYSESDVSRLREIVRLKRLLGFTLSEIKEIVEGDEARSQLHSEYHATDNAATRLLKLDEARSVTIGQLAMVERKLDQMRDLRDDLIARLARYEQKRLELDKMVIEGTTR